MYRGGPYYQDLYEGYEALWGPQNALIYFIPIFIVFI